jgi:hypothetical protein
MYSTRPEPGLGARLHAAVEKVAARVPVVRQRIGAAQHEQRAVPHVVDVVDPGRWRIQRVALEDLGAHHEHQRDDQLRGGLAHQGAESVGGVEQSLRVHRGTGTQSRRQAHHPKASGWRAGSDMARGYFFAK